MSDDSTPQINQALIWFALNPMLDSLCLDLRFATILARIGLDF
jgi:hypothetical protein